MRSLISVRGSETSARKKRKRSSDSIRSAEMGEGGRHSSSTFSKKRAAKVASPSLPTSKGSSERR